MGTPAFWNASRLICIAVLFVIQGKLDTFPWKDESLTSEGKIFCLIVECELSQLSTSANRPACKPGHVRRGVAPCFDFGAYHLWILYAELIGDQIHVRILLLERWEQLLLPVRFRRRWDRMVQVDCYLTPGRR